MKHPILITFFVLGIMMPVLVDAQSVIYNTNNTGGDKNDYWSRIASVTITKSYQDDANTIELLGNGTSNSTIYWGKLVVRCKRQNSNPDGPPTNFQMHLYNSKLGADKIKAVQNHNTVDVYIKIPNTYTRIYFTSLIHGGDSFIFYSDEPLLQNLPSGDNIYDCKDGQQTTEYLEILQEEDPGTDRALIISEPNNSQTIKLHLADNQNGEYGYLSLGGYTSLRGNGQKSYFEGAVGIGTTSLGSDKLSVNGTIRSKEVKVEASPWPDYVFSKDYKLTSLAETETFIQQNGHLPEVPSAQQVEEEGISLGEMNAILLKKIEELTLHVIELEKRLNDFNKL